MFLCNPSSGCGKSSLLKILAETCGAAGEHTSVADDGVVYTGNVEKAKDCTVAYVEQEPPMSSEVTVYDALLGFSAATIDGGGTSSTKPPTDVYDAINQYRVSIQLAESDPERFAAASTHMDEMDGWKVLGRVDEISTRLRVKALEDQPLSTLSGGERKRVALAAAFIALSNEPNAVLLLDEPTNHLDLSAIRWLAECIKLDRKMTVLCVTHDRAFLDDICDGVVELDGGNIYSYSGAMADSGRGGYSAYLEGKEARLLVEDANLRAASAKYRTELDWMRRQPQARESKGKARIDAFYKLEKATQPRAAEANLDINSNDGQRRIGKNVLSIKKASLLFGEKTMLDDFTYNFNRGDRIGIVGSNG